MKLLLIDDDPNTVAAVEEELSGHTPAIELSVCGSQSMATELLTEEFFDLVLCDLRLPIEEGGLDAEVPHGLAVYGVMQDKAPGTPVMFFSAFDVSVAVMQRLLLEASQEDPFGTGEAQQMISFHPKDELHECLEKIRDAAKKIALVKVVELNFGLHPIDLGDEERRVIRLFAARHYGSIVEVERLAGGLSSATVLRLKVKDNGGGLTASVVAKIDGLSHVRDELHAFETLVSSILPNGSYTPVTAPVFSGAGRLGGLFYSPVPGENQHLWSLLQSDEEEAIRTLAGLRENLGRWREGVPTKEINLFELRKDFLSEDEFQVALSRCDELDLSSIEDFEFVGRINTQHGDLHVFNVLTEAGRPVIIDFGRVGKTVSSLDAVTLELSLLFHPDTKGFLGEWPSLEQARSWAILDDFVLGCPFEKFIRACREWAHECSGGSREVMAAALWYCVRQLKYEDTDHELACAMAVGLLGALLKS